MRFIENYPIDQITPADYNPRKIKENAFEKLQESLLKFGVCKAVIANLDGTIVAGHQRTKAMKAVGINHCPIFILEKNVSLQDEIKFNLMHNSVETETAKMRIDNAADIPFGFTLVKNEHLETVHNGKGSIIKEISRLISKYGDYGNIIVDEDGNVIHNADYAYCCKLLGTCIDPLQVTLQNDININLSAISLTVPGRLEPLNVGEHFYMFAFNNGKSYYMMDRV